MSHPNYRLVSLWDMIQLPIGPLLEASRKLGTFGQMLRSQVGDNELQIHNGVVMVEAAEKFVEGCSAFELTVSAGLGGELLTLLSGLSIQDNYLILDSDSVRKATAIVGAINKGFPHDTKSKIALILEAKDKALWSPDDPAFGPEVEAKYPLAKEDIEEAGKCLAVGRGTACVFHLSRAMESAVQTLSTSLGIPSPEREWGKLLSDMKAKIEAMPAGDLKNRWSENHSLLYHVKQAWRNDVMHPKATYTVEQALEVHQAMRSFMRNLVPLVS